MKPWERNHIDSQLAEICIQLSREAKAGGHARHGEADQMVEVSVRGRGELESPEADVVESLVVNAISLVSVFDKLMD